MIYSIVNNPLVRTFRKLAGYVYHFFAFTALKSKFLLKHGTFDFFDDVDIETNTGCNRRCVYCPNSIYDRGLVKKQKLMDENLFKKIIDELVRIGFDGRISPHLYGEPLLDKRIPRLIRYVRTKLPKVRIVLVSNGDLLTIDKYIELSDAGVNNFRITQHGKEMNPNIKDLFEFIKKRSNKKAKVWYELADLGVPLYNRGGLIKPPIPDYNPRCLCINNPLVIDYDGNVILCCNDYLSSIKFGNLRNKSLLDIWNSRQFKEIRKQLKRREFNLDICKKCVGIYKE